MQMQFKTPTTIEFQMTHTIQHNTTQHNKQVLMKMQDAGLDALSESVMRIGEMSNGISDELGHQNKMLDSMETDLDTAGEELDIVTRSTKQLIAKSGGMSTFCLIVTLSIVVLFLLFLIIYG
jgi:archaellum component FlaC